MVTNWLRPIAIEMWLWYDCVLHFLRTNRISLAKDRPKCVINGFWEGVNVNEKLSAIIWSDHAAVAAAAATAVKWKLIPMHENMKQM